jgi:hypothetical protein
LPAIDRYDGLLVRVIRRAIREGHIDLRDVVIVSPTLGLLRGSDAVPYHKPIGGNWQDLELDTRNLENMNRLALHFLKDLTESSEFSEVYVNVGKKLTPIIAGIEKVVPCKVVYATGCGPGPKAAHMRDWLLARNSKKRH